MRPTLPEALAVDLPVLAAPMAGGATTPALVAAAAGAGSLGFLPGGYRSAAELAAQIAELRGKDVRFGVNLFAPNPVPVDPAAYASYREAIDADTAAVGADPGPEAPVEDDDAWDEKLALLLADPVPLVSFTFGIPGRSAIAELERVGTLVAQTVTNADEAIAAAEAGARLLIVQAASAGGHSGTLSPERLPEDVPLPELIDSVRRAVELPLIGAGGIAAAADAEAAIAAGAAAVAIGTLLLRSEESGASPVHRGALADPAFTETAVTRAFTGRPARGLRNAFVDAHAGAPHGYPALHHLTSPMRRAAAAAGDAQRLHLWAGTGYRAAREAPAAEILRSLAPR